MLRTLVAVVIVAGIGTASWFAYSKYYERDRLAAKQARELEDARRSLAEKDQLLLDQAAQIDRLEIKVDKLDTALRLMKVDHRVATLNVLNQWVDPDTNKQMTRVTFTETDDTGKAIDKAKTFNIEGKVVYIASWVVKFDDKYVEEADLHRSTSLVLFRRLFGENQTPSSGHLLDEPGVLRPKVYGGGEISEFEKKIWEDFWSIANDEDKAKEVGIRAAHGDAPFIKVEKGKSYRVTLRASDGLSIKPISKPAKLTKPAT